MVHYVALLRGINVGGRNRVAMADLRAVMDGLGHTNVSTYLQSGNAVFSSDRTDVAEMAGEIQQRLDEVTGVKPTVLLRSGTELAEVIAANPEPAADAEPTKLHVGFLSADVAPQQVAAVDRERFAPDRLHPGPQAVYLWYEHGAGRSKLTTTVLERQLHVRVTARNWKTVRALAERLS